MLRKTSALALAAMIATSGPVAAAEHLVMMMGDGFFPDVVYVEDGDTIRFVNASGSAQTAAAVDGSWSTGEMGVDEEAEIVFYQGMERAFNANDIVELDGLVRFGEPPLGLN